MLERTKRRTKAARSTRSWKHARKDKRQYIFHGECRCIDKDDWWSSGFYPVNTTKRDTPFMREDLELAAAG